MMSESTSLAECEQIGSKIYHVFDNVSIYKAGGVSRVLFAENESDAAKYRLIQYHDKLPWGRRVFRTFIVQSDDETRLPRKVTIEASKNLLSRVYIHHIEELAYIEMTEMNDRHHYSEIIDDEEMSDAEIDNVTMPLNTSVETCDREADKTDEADEADKAACDALSFDNEIRALKDAWEAIESLDGPARDRVIDWLKSRSNSEKTNLQGTVSLRVA